MRHIWRATLLLIFMDCFGCSTPLPENIGDYADECILMTPEPHAPTKDDPHAGYKNVYACGISLEELTALADEGTPWPDGSMVLKESTKIHQDHSWLIATATKQSGEWSWAEYTRNFGGEEFAQIPVGEDTCIDCHQKVESTDFIYTPFIPEIP